MEGGRKGQEEGEEEGREGGREGGREEPTSGMSLRISSDFRIWPNLSATCIE